MLTTSKTKAINVLLDSPFTAHMNAITPFQVVSFYPRLTYANESMEVDRVVEPRERQLSVALTASNAHWTKPCGYYCPMRWRKTFGDPGVATYSWSPYPRQPKSDWNNHSTLVTVGKWGDKLIPGWNTAPPPIPTEDLRLQQPLRWRISSTCSNPHCANHQLRGRLFEVLRSYI